MPKRVLVLSVVAAMCFLCATQVDSQEVAGARRNATLALLKARIDLQVHELRLQLSQLAVREAEVECEKIRAKLDALRERGVSPDAAHTELELKQTMIRVDMRRVESDIAQCDVEWAKAVFEQIREAGRHSAEREAFPKQTLDAPQLPGQDAVKDAGALEEEAESRLRQSPKKPN